MSAMQNTRIETPSAAALSSGEEKPADAQSADGKARAGLMAKHRRGDAEWVPDWDGWLAEKAARRAAAQGGGNHGSALCLGGLGGGFLHTGTNQFPIHLVVEVFAGNASGGENHWALLSGDAPSLQPVLDVLSKDTVAYCFCQLGWAAFEGIDGALNACFVCHGRDFNAK